MMREKLEADAEFCNYCSDNCPPQGYWHCPVCDAEWPDDDTDTPAEALLSAIEAELRTLRAERDAAKLRGVALGIEAAAKWVKADAQVCDCDAHSESECACGAWCEWKTVPMFAVIAGLEALDPAAIIAAQGDE
jgi:hypothetical protein